MVDHLDVDSINALIFVLVSCFMSKLHLIWHRIRKDVEYIAFFIIKHLLQIKVNWLRLFQQIAIRKIKGAWMHCSSSEKLQGIVYHRLIFVQCNICIFYFCKELVTCHYSIVSIIACSLQIMTLPLFSVESWRIPVLESKKKMLQLTYSVCVNY